jgi:hypothetical protein
MALRASIRLLKVSAKGSSNAAVRLPFNHSPLWHSAAWTLYSPALAMYVLQSGNGQVNGMFLLSSK